MGAEHYSALQWLALVEYELLLFAGVFFLLGALDELAIDVLWLRLWLTGECRTPVLPTENLRYRPLDGRAAAFIPAWLEATVIEQTIAHALAAWPQAELTIYIGCYRNDPATLDAAVRGAQGDPRVRVVVHERDGPSTKADCLNRLYAALEQDEQRLAQRYRFVVLHDAEDMVDPAALTLLDVAMASHDFVQLPVVPLPQSGSRWVGSHYCEEFAEAHGKALVVRDSLGTGIPAAGVGCAFAREILARLAWESDARGPFCEHSLTEDYELGLRVAGMGGKSSFLRVRGENGQLIATRAYFPADLGKAVRQKARWMQGIAFQGWDRLGWSGSLAERWMRARDRRGPLSALVLLSGYLLMVVALVVEVAVLLGAPRPWVPGGLMSALVIANMVSFAWRAAMRFGFTARLYGAREGWRAVLRIPLANVIAIMAAWRAVWHYSGTLRGRALVWEKTTHDMHPAARTELGMAR